MVMVDADGVSDNRRGQDGGVREVEPWKNPSAGTRWSQ